MGTRIEAGRWAQTRRIRLGVIALLLAAAATAAVLTLPEGTVGEGRAPTKVTSVQEATLSEATAGECSSSTQYCERIAARLHGGTCASTTQYCERIAPRGTEESVYSSLTGAEGGP